MDEILLQHLRFADTILQAAGVASYWKKGVDGITSDEAMQILYGILVAGVDDEDIIHSLAQDKVDAMELMDPVTVLKAQEQGLLPDVI